LEHFQIRNRIRMKIQGTFMSQIRLKFGFDELKKFRIWWNLSSRTLITSRCQVTLYPRDLRFTREDSLIDLKI
jgi:hypothetical protein